MLAFRLSLLERPYRLLEKAHVGVDADPVGEPGLFPSQEIPGSSELHVVERNRVAAPQFSVMLQHPEAALRLVGQPVRRDQIAIGPAIRASHPAPGSDTAGTARSGRRRSR